MRWGPASQWLRSAPTRALVAVRGPIRHRQPLQDLDRHRDLAVNWLLTAHAVGSDGGVPAFYDLLRDVWMPSYPETTGYVVPTLLKHAKNHGREDVRRVGLEMAEYLLQAQTPAGGICGWTADSPPYVFDTGQVLFGWLAALQETGHERYRDALVRSADWLVTHQEPGGYWLQYQYGGHVKVWDVRVAWPLLVVGRALDQPTYRAAGRRCLDWALTHQENDGWFRHNSLKPGRPAVTHTIAYTVEGFLESGLLCGDERYVQAARRAANALLTRQHPDGRLSAYWSPGWLPLGRSSCLTGNAQMALCWLRLHWYTGDERYMEAGQRALAFVASTQCLDSQWPPVRGAIAGSWPVWGPYLRWCYPNWATKFFLDALLLYQALEE
jgi:rhamnogalacturonyl hydrolase YesR